MFSFIKQKSIYITGFLLLLFIIAFCITLSKYFVIDYDDACNIFYDKETGLANNFVLNIYHGRYISNFLQKTIGYIIPNILNIHPNVWIKTGGAVIKGIFYFIYVCMLADIAFLNRKKNIFYILTAFLLYIFIQYYLIMTYEDELYTAFYGFTFPFIIFFAFWKKFLLINQNDLKDNNTLYLLAFCVSISTEFTAITSTIAIFIYFVTDLLRNKVFNKTCLKLNLIMLVGNILYFTNEGFLGAAKRRGTLADFNSTITNAVGMFNEYISGFKHVFKTDFIYFIIPIIFIFIIFIYNNQIKNKAIILTTSVALFTAQWIFYMLLIFAGRHESGISYVTHFDIIMQMDILFIYIFYLLISNIRNKYIFYTLILIPFIVSTLLNFPEVKKQFLHFKKWGYYNYSIGFLYIGKEEYSTRYINERLLAYYGYKNEIPTLSEKAKSFMLDTRLYIQSVYNKDYSHKYNEIEYTPTIEEAYNIYLKNGGKEIKENELETPDYQKLTNKNFVLYGG